MIMWLPKANLGCITHALHFDKHESLETNPRRRAVCGLAAGVFGWLKADDEPGRRCKRCDARVTKFKMT